MGEQWSWQWCIWLSCGSYALCYLLASAIGKVEPAGSLFPLYLVGYLVAGVIGFFLILGYRINWTAHGYQHGLMLVCGILSGVGAMLYFMALNRAGENADHQGKIAAIFSVSPAPAAIILIVAAAVTDGFELKTNGLRLLGAVLVFAGLYILSKGS